MEENKQIEKYLIDYLITKDEEELEKIIKSTKAMVYHIINKYYSTRCHFERIDYYQMVVMKYPFWIDRYANSEQNGFVTYLYTCIKNFLLKVIRKENAQKRKSDLVYFETVFSGRELTEVISDNPEVEQSYINAIRQEQMFDQIIKLFGEEGKIYIGHLEGYKVKELAKVFAKEEKYIRKVITKIKTKLKNNPDLLKNLL